MRLLFKKAILKGTCAEGLAGTPREPTLQRSASGRKPTDNSMVITHPLRCAWISESMPLWDGSTSSA